jgi:dihydroxyacetone kinase
MCHVQNFVSVTDVRNYTGDRLNFTLAAQKVDTLGPDVRTMAEA